MPKISIVVPVYKVENVVGECIDSILRQTFCDFELLLVNDGSPDNSLAICESYALKDSRIRIQNKENGGVSSARNLGIQEAKGEWIVFIDSDDFVLPEYLADFNIDENNEDLIVQGLQYYNSQENKYLNEIRYKSTFATGSSMRDIITDNKLLHSGYPFSKAFKLSIIREWNITFNEKISFHEDHIFVFQYLVHINALRTVDKVSYKYRIAHNDNSLSRKKHEWRNQLLSAELMLEGYYLLKSKFNLSNVNYQKEILTFCSEPKIDAIFSLYSDRNNSYAKKKESMNQIIGDRRKFLNEYHPVIFRYRLIKYTICYLPFFLKDIFFRFVNRYQNRSL